MVAVGFCCMLLLVGIVIGRSWHLCLLLLALLIAGVSVDFVGVVICCSVLAVVGISVVDCCFGCLLLCIGFCWFLVGDACC